MLSVFINNCYRMEDLVFLSISRGLSCNTTKYFFSRFYHTWGSLQGRKVMVIPSLKLKWNESASWLLSPKFAARFACKLLPVLEGWVTPWSLIPKGRVTHPGVQWLPTEGLDTDSILQTHFDVLGSTLDHGKVPCEICTCQGHIKCRQHWDCKTRELTTGHYSEEVQWVMTSKTIFCTASILRDIPRAKKQICQENAEKTSRLRLESSEHNWEWAIGSIHFKCVKLHSCMLLYCIVFGSHPALG